MVELVHDDERWAVYRDRYGNGEWRAPVFRDMILNDLQHVGLDATCLDIGCGLGFDNELSLQEQLSRRCGHLVGVEPDKEITVAPYFNEVHRCTFQQAPIRPHSINVAWSVMVLEHVTEPPSFWKRLWDVLDHDGVFWGFTVDARHYFARLSGWAERLGLSSWILRRLQATKGKGHYEHYPVVYRANSPRQIQGHVQSFARCDFVSFRRVGQFDPYLPKWTHRPVHVLDALLMKLGRPGALLAVRLEK